MAETKPTSGEWEAVPEKFLIGGECIAGRSPAVKCGDKNIAKVYRQTHSHSGPCLEAEANAILMAAVKNLLAACELACTEMSQCGLTYHGRTIIVLKDAIATAKGITP